MEINGYSFDIANPPGPSEIAARFTKLIRDCFPRLDAAALEPSTPFGLLIQQLTLVELQRINDILYEINKRQGNVHGLDLDVQLINNFGLFRKPAAHGTAKVTIYGEPHYTVPAGFEVTGTDTPVFRLLYEAQISAEGSVAVDMQCVEFSQKVYPSNSLQYIVTSDYNIHRVTQTEVTLPGVPAESDLDYQTRAYLWGALSNNSSFESIVSRVYSVPGVTKCNGYENPRAEEHTHQGTKFAPHSVGIVVLGGDKKQIADAIHKAKPPGVVLMGTEEVKLMVNTKEIIYKFYRPTPVPLQAYVKVTLLHLYPNNYVELIKQELVNYVNGLKINSRILYSGVTCALHTLQVTNGYKYEYVEIKFGKKAGTAGFVNLDLQFVEMATLAPEDITVEKTA